MSVPCWVHLLLVPLMGSHFCKPRRHWSHLSCGLRIISRDMINASLLCQSCLRSSPHEWLQISQMGLPWTTSHLNPANQQIDLGCQDWQQLPASTPHTSHRKRYYPARPQRAVEMTNELGDGKLVWGRGGKFGYEVGVTMVLFYFFHFPSFCCPFFEHGAARHEDLRRNYSC